MEIKNSTSIEMFILLGFSHVPHLRLPLAYIFSFVYSCILLGNGLIILIIIGNHQLHSPMYFFLTNLSTLDIFSPTVIIPKMIKDLASKDGIISLHGCITQLFFFITFISIESPLLCAMAFDRYIAICNPLHYKIIFNHTLCCRLACGAWILGCSYSLILTMLTQNLYFCGPNQIDHFFCDFLPLFKLACSNISLTVQFLYVLVFVNGICNFSIILSSYSSIVNAIIKIQSKDGRIKTFSTCASHLMVVSMYYVTVITAYFHPIDSYSESKDRTAAVFYTMVTPVLNPFVYSFRNSDVKNALKKLLAIKSA